MKVLRYLLQNPLSLFGMIMLVSFALVAIFAPVLATPEAYQLSPYSTPRSGFWQTPQPPSPEHILERHRASTTSSTVWCGARAPHSRSGSAS